MRTLRRYLYYLLYHPFAFAYDLVAATVSVGRWKSWVLSVLPYIQGTRILEIGHGPGHLQRALLQKDLFVVGIDASASMGKVARSNLSHSARASTSSSHPIDYTNIRLVRALGQYLPFPEETFDTVAATFPAGYIFEPITLAEIHHVLNPGGRLVILPGATLLGRGLMDRLMAWVFRFTGQAPPNLIEILQERSQESFTQADFQVQAHELEIKSSRVFILVATKPMQRKEL